MEKRLNYIDWAKAIGIVLVCIGHFLPAGDAVKVVIYTFHVPVFVFVSGLLMTAPNGAKHCFGKIGKFALRIMLPYTVWHAISVAIYLRRGLCTWGPNIWKTWLFLEGKTIWNDALWYAPTIFLALSVLCIFLWLVRGNRMAALLLSFASLSGFVLWGQRGFSLELFGFQNFLGLQNFLLFLGLLSLGYVCRDAVRFLIERKENPYQNGALYASLGAFVVLLILVERLNHKNNISVLYSDYNNVIVFAIFAALLSFTFIVSCALLPRSKIASILSRNSLFIMCSHYLFLLWIIRDMKIGSGKETLLLRYSIVINLILLYVIVCSLAKMITKKFPKTKEIFSLFGMAV